ncbi:MAG: protein translocase subunit SecD [Planctomycetes bacterium]|nr:protein translocase subunit SecD [Planctomycetota bacterium]
MANKKYLALLPAAVFAYAVGIAAFGGLTYTMFDQWRRSALLDDYYQKALKSGEEAVDQLVLAPGEPKLSGLYQPIAPNGPLASEYATAKKDSINAVTAFWDANIQPPNWVPWVCLLGLVLLWPVLSRLFRPLFEDYTKRMVFVMLLGGLLGGYFGYLGVNNIYPMGIDLAGGTELVYRLDYKELERRMESTQERLGDLTEARDSGQKKTKDGTTVKQDGIDELTRSLETLRLSKEQAPERAVEIVRKRIDPTGTKGIPVTKYGEQRLRIQLPKASPEEVERIKRAIRTQGRLTFHICSDDRELNEKVMKDKETKTHRLLYIKKFNKFTGKEETPDPVVIERDPMMEGSGVQYAGTQRGDRGGYEINLQFDPPNRARFADITGKNIGKRMAIVLDNICYSAPTIQERIDGTCRITGNFSQKEAKDLASVLTAGSLPAEVLMESEFTVGPTLGQEQIETGIRATLVGAALVALFMWIYYRIGGFVTVFCLGLNLVILMGSLGFFKATMTLPGIAGILLTMGMAVDANVLIFERIREELARGRILRLAVQHGFDRAVVTIMDSQLTTLLTAIILYYLGSGPVRGFAVTLSLGILITIFTNVWVCRQFLEWLVAKDAVADMKMLQMFAVPKIDFMAQRKQWIIGTGAMVVLSIASFVHMGVLNTDIYDLDFTGGTLIQFNFRKGREQLPEDVKKTVDGKLKSDLENRLKSASAKLKELAASNKTGPDLRKALYQELPVIGHARFGTASELSGEALLEEAEILDKVLASFEKSRFVVQSFGDPKEAQGGRFGSYTLTTRIDEASIVEVLYDELLKVWPEDIELPAVEYLENKKELRLRLKNVEALPDAPAKERLVATIQSEIAALAAEDANKDLAGLLKPLEVSEVKRDAGEGEGGHPYVTLSPIPPDLADRELLMELLDGVPVKYGNEKYRAEGPVSRKTSFGSQVAGEMRRTALLAGLAALAGIFMYLWFRFEFSGAWGFGAILALFHDAMIAIGAVCLFNYMGWLTVLVDLNLVAAVLTIIGFSVNDTIVIYDRIREIRAAHPTRDLSDIINEATNATLSRTVLTTGTVLLATLSLFLMGGETIQGLSFTLLVGFMVGTYSSVFVASPLMRWWLNKYGAGKAPVPGLGRQPAQDAGPSGAQI